MRKLVKLTMSIVLLTALNASAQTVGIGTNAPNGSAQLDITSANKGLLIPRVSLTGLTDVTTIPTPATGLLIFNTNAAVTGGTGFYYNSGTTGAPSWLKLQTGAGGGSGWGLTGNAGTNSLANFIGTTDNQSLTFRVNNGFAGQIGSAGLVALGRGAAGFELTNAPGVIAVGDSALFNNTGDSSEIAIGNSALFSQSTAGNGDNVAIGNLSLVSSTSGAQNTAVGMLTLLNNNDTSNTAVGFAAALGTIGWRNTAVGALALANDVQGVENTAVGFGTLNSNGTGVDNVAVGILAMVSNVDGSLNTAVGNQALFSNIGGDTTGNFNTAIGSEALLLNEDGSRNTAVGRASFLSDSTGNRNTGLGYFSGLNTKTGSNNVAIGSYAMRTNTAGNSNVCVGDSADIVGTLGATLTNSIAIGARAVSNASNKAVIGNTSMTSIGGQVGWTTFSDGRYKTNVEETVSGLDFIMKLRPVTYTYDFEKIDNEINHRGYATSTSGLSTPFRTSLPGISGRSGKFAALDKKKNTTKFKIGDDGKPNASISLPNPNEGVRFTGFIAQEVEAAAKTVGFDFSGVDKPTTPGANYGLRYAEFTVPLVKAVQEQQAIIDAQNKKIEELTKRLEKLENK